MQRKDLAIGLIVLAIIAGIVFLVQRRRQDLVVPTPVPSSTPSLEEAVNRIEDSFRVDIPDDVEKADLRDTRNTGFGGIVTRDVKGNSSNITVLADMEDPEAGKFYQVWIRKPGQTRLLGTMRVSKGGYLSDVTLSEDLSSFNEIIVSLETKNDNTLEETVLQGSF